MIVQAPALCVSCDECRGRVGGPGWVNFEGKAP